MSKSSWEPPSKTSAKPAAWPAWVPACWNTPWRPWQATQGNRKGCPYDILILNQYYDPENQNSPDFKSMTPFDFKSYHHRSIHASAEERAAINQELKDLYASLSEEDKKAFNEQLQTFLVREMGRLKTDYEAIKNQQSDIEP